MDRTEGLHWVPVQLGVRIEMHNFLYLSVIGLEAGQIIFQLSLHSDGQPLDNNAGYWAESFPSAESSLCAAIDPARNFRWHALNCNGEATAAFLCEMPGKRNSIVLQHLPGYG